MHRPHSRRRFLELIAFGAIAAPLAPRARAADLPHVEETDPTASSLGYRHDGSSVDAAKYPNHKPEQVCSNCKLALAPQGDGWLPCQIFPGKSVDPKGWCAAWVAKA